MSSRKLEVFLFFLHYFLKKSKCHIQLCLDSFVILSCLDILLLYMQQFVRKIISFCRCFFHIHTQDHTKLSGRYSNDFSQIFATSWAMQSTTIYWLLQSRSFSLYQQLGWGIKRSIPFYRCQLSAQVNKSSTIYGLMIFQAQM